MSGIYYVEAHMNCHECKKEIVKSNGIGTGYGLNDKKQRICYACCAVEDKKWMDEKGLTSLYFIENGNGMKVTNWPASLEYPIIEHSKSRHNWGLTRTDFWFNDHKGNRWWGYHIGEWTQLARCQRVKNI